MRCAWKELLSILPTWMRHPVDELGRDTLQELRLRRGRYPELIRANGNTELPQAVSEEDLRYVVNTASRYSPWASETVARGYITAAGGHRIGLCGEAVLQECSVRGLRRVDSLCVRVARDICDIATGLQWNRGSILLIGPPGYGKTTLLRDLIRLRAKSETVAVVDERGELFPVEGGFALGKRMDVLIGCPKPQGIEMLLRVMGPSTVAVDEITSEQDCDALLQAGWCGVSLLATAHAASVQDLMSRPVYRPLLRSGLFNTVVTLHRDKSWKAEDME